MYQNKYTSPVKVAPKLGCRFFRTEQGNEPVREWLKMLPDAVKKAIGSDVQRVQWQWPVSKMVSTVVSMRYGRRSIGSSIASMLALPLLHGFVKKARTAPDDIALGRERQKQLKPETST